MSFTPDTLTTEEALASILESPLPSLPPQEQRYGSTLVSWWETDPGEVYIHAERGTPDDRHYASTLIALQLQPHGYRRAQFDMDGPEDLFNQFQEPHEFDAGQQVWTPTGQLGRIERFYTTLPGTQRAVVHSLGDGEEQHHDVADLEPQTQSGYGSAFGNEISDLSEVHPGDLLYAGSGTHQGEPNVLRVLSVESKGFTWQFVDPANPLQRRLPSDQEHFTWANTIPAQGYRRADDLGGGVPDILPRTMARTASWPDLMAKAKRLVDSGQVHVLRNGYNNIMGHVIGDHGEYDSEIARDDPQTRSITGWQCTCPWDQYAWQRTRKWKKFEGRPCAHVLGLYWKALSTPLDEQLTEEQAMGLGTGQRLPGDQMIGPRGPSVPHVPGGPSGPRVFGPEGPEQGKQMQMNLPPDALGGPPGPAQAPIAPPPGNGGPGGHPGGPSGPEPPGVIPPFPGEQQQLPWAGPGTTPGGMESPPGAMSLPGAKVPNPFNPIQNPGTYSKVAADFNPPETVRFKKPVLGIAEGPVQGQYGDGEYRENEDPSGEVISQDPSTGWVEVISPLHSSGPHEPYHIRAWCDPSELEKSDTTNAFIKRK